MSQQELLNTVIEVLNRSGIDYMLTGSLVSSLQGEPRATHDIDIVVTIERSDISSLLSAFSPPRFYLDEEAASDAIEQGGTFNLIDTSTGNKVDFWLLTDDAFDSSRFGRKQEETILGVPILVSTPEDTIMMKLRWAKMSGGSEKQFTDALRVYEIQFGKLDRAYLHEWSVKLGVERLFEDLEAKAAAERGRGGQLLEEIKSAYDGKQESEKDHALRMKRRHRDI